MDEIKRNLEIRKENLIYLLKNKKDQLELEKQHQIYGAIKELDYIMRMLSYSDEETAPPAMEANINVMADGPEKVSVMKKISEQVRSFKNPIRIRFQRNEP